MNYKDYQNARDMAWEILIQEGITELPVNILLLCRRLGVESRYYVPGNEGDGKSMMFRDVPYILVSKSCTTARQKFTAAHELGHVLLGHTGKYALVNREPSPNDNPIEQAANVFASRLLAPACVLWGCGVTRAEDIAALCGISMQSAEYRMKRMEELYQRNKFLTSPLERQVYAQFEGFIKNHRL